MAIGALPALCDGNEKRDLTQQWARAIYEDQPAWRRVTGIRYRSAYNGGISLALWDISGQVRTVMTRRRVADYALASRELLARVQTELAMRLISYELVAPADCPVCTPP
jgi:RES domain